MPPNRFKHLLTAGQRAAGTMVFEFNTPGIARVLDATGVDFVVFDMEHSGFEIGDIRAVLAGARGTSFTPMVRVPMGASHFLARVLDHRRPGSDGADGREPRARRGHRPCLQVLS